MIRNGTFPRYDRSELSVMPGLFTTDGAWCTGVATTCAAGLTTSPPNADPTTTTVSGLPACCASGAISGGSGATFVCGPIATASWRAACFAFGCTVSK